MHLYFSACTLGYYGKNCVSKCSKWCTVNETELWCNKTDGLCLSGCKKGFKQTDGECTLYSSMCCIVFKYWNKVLKVKLIVEKYKYATTANEQSAKVLINVDLYNTLGI